MPTRVTAIYSKSSAQMSPPREDAQDIWTLFCEHRSCKMMACVCQSDAEMCFVWPEQGFVLVLPVIKTFLKI